MNRPPPLTDVERQKGFNIRQNNPKYKNTPTRQLEKLRLWLQRNTKGNPIK